MKKPEVDSLCWVLFDGQPMLSRVYRVTKCYYQCTNENAFVDREGRYCGSKEMFTIPPGHKLATFRPYVEGEPAPAFNLKTGLPADMPGKPTPLF